MGKTQSGPADEITEEKRIDYLAVLAERLNFPIARVIKYGVVNSKYTIVLPDKREVNVGNSEILLSVRRFERCPLERQEDGTV